MVRVVELLSPMTEIRREDEECRGIIEVRWEDFAIIFGHFFIDRASEDRDYFDVPAECLSDERQMHLDAVLFLIIVNVQHMEPFLQFQLVYCLHINIQRADRGAVLIHVGKRAPREILVVGRTEDEHALDIIGTSHILIGPGCSGPTEVESCMGTDQCFDSLGMHLLLSPVNVLRQFGTQLRSYINNHLRLLVYHSPACKHCRDCFSIISHPIQTTLKL